MQVIDHGGKRTRSVMLRRVWIWLACWDALPVFFWHGRIRVVQEFGSHVRKFRCERCGKYFGMRKWSTCMQMCLGMEEQSDEVLRAGVDRG